MKLAWITARIPAALKERLKKLAKAQERSISQVIRRLLEKALA